MGNGGQKKIHTADPAAKASETSDNPGSHDGAAFLSNPSVMRSYLNSKLA